MRGGSAGAGRSLAASAFGAAAIGVVLAAFVAFAAPTRADDPSCPSGHRCGGIGPYDYTGICNALSEHGRDFALDLIKMYYGVGESTAQRILSDSDC